MGREQVKSEIEIRMMRTGEEEELMAFMMANLVNRDRFEKLWKWRIDRQAVSGGETAAIGKQSGKIVGCVGVVPAVLTIRGKRIYTSWQQDSLVSPAMRGQGLGRGLVKEASKGWNFVMAKGTSEAMYGLRKSMGFSDVPNSDYLVRVEKFRADKRELKKSAVEMSLFLWKMVFPGSTAKEKIEVKPVGFFDGSFNALAEKVSNQPGVRMYKGQDYLNWRYVECPGKRYHIFRAGRQEARGAIVLNVTGQKGEEGWFVDMICPVDDEECANTLVGEGIRYLREKNVSRIYTFATLPEARKRFRRFGFLPTGRSPRFTYRVSGEGVDYSALSGAAWDFWHGDGDVELYM